MKKIREHCIYHKHVYGPHVAMDSLFAALAQENCLSCPSPLLWWHLCTLSSSGTQSEEGFK